MWLAALSGRLAYVAHRAGGHAVTWKTSPPDTCLCAGDVVCHDCGQVLWCRAHDPWRAETLESAPDHWGGTREGQSRWTLFESLQHLLRLAEACPSGPSGDQIRRAACELIEAESAQRRSACRLRLLKVVDDLEGRRLRGRHRGDDPPPVILKQLTDALRLELRPG